MLNEEERLAIREALKEGPKTTLELAVRLDMVGNFSLVQDVLNDMQRDRKICRVNTREFPKPWELAR